MIEEYSLAGLERQVLNRIQSDFPLTDDPYGQLADEMNVSRTQIHQTVCALRREGIIRRIGASYHAAKLGYVTTLVSAEVDPCQIEQVADYVNQYAEVTHNYQREHRFNLWFTAIAHSHRRLQDILNQTGRLRGIRQINALPSCHTFKLKVEFHFEAPPLAKAVQLLSKKQVKGHMGQPVKRPVLNKPLVAYTCGNIDESLDPYGNMASNLQMTRRELLHTLHVYRKEHILRRFGAILRHQAAGFAGNGMTVWRVPDKRIHEVGSLFAAQPQISHCYQRQAVNGWPYNLYAMAHGSDYASVQTLCRRLADLSGIREYEILFSTQEFKKTSMRYFAGYA